MTDELKMPALPGDMYWEVKGKRVLEDGVSERRVRRVVVSLVKMVNVKTYHHRTDWLLFWRTKEWEEISRTPNVLMEEVVRRDKSSLSLPLGFIDVDQENIVRTAEYILELYKKEKQVNTLLGKYPPKVIGEN